MKRFIRDYFTFTSREKTGIVIILILVVLVIALNFMLRQARWPVKHFDYAAYNEQLDSFQNSINPANGWAENEGYIKNYTPPVLFPFDPNTASFNELIQLGVEDRIARRIVTYRKKGGRFEKKEDLLKIYGFNRMTYAMLVPYVRIVGGRKTFTAVEQVNNYPVPVAAVKIEINSSDTSQLKSIRGIGSVLAGRIVKYRYLLGGFYSIQQLSEVYGISDSLLLTFQDRILVDTAWIRPIEVNTVTESQLARHPYVGNYIAKGIVSFRESSGKIKSMEELVQHKLIPSNRQEQLKYYLIFN